MGGVADEDETGAVPRWKGVAGEEGPELDVFTFAGGG